MAIKYRNPFVNKQSYLEYLKPGLSRTGAH